MSVKVGEMLQHELRYDELKEFFWTDSQVVLAYIQNDARRFHTYVANRVQQIRDHTTPDQWNYVESKHNPADDASRGLSAQNLLQSPRWIRGPAFLWEPHQNWRDYSGEPTELPPGDKEVKKSSAFATSSNDSTVLPQRLEYFSDWFRAKRALAICVRYLRILLDRVRTRKATQTRKTSSRPLRQEPVMVEELKSAEQKIIKSAQREAFGNELKALKSVQANSETETREGTKQRNAEMKKTSDLYRLDPFLDEHGILRVGGRIRQASLAYEVKHPVILPRRGHVSRLVVKNFHEKTAHQGRGFTTNEVRSSGYWVVGCSAAVSELIQNCTTCKRIRASTQEQKMADLPKDRLEPAPPFSYCGVDYFGPWYVKEGRKELKRYGVLFTCMASRAIHLEVASTMETNSFINALRRFICRRGPIRQLRSDRGTNFIGARRELREAISEMDQNQVKAEMLKLNCDWVEVQFNVPSASHMGGVWEQQIRTVRSVLSAILEKNGTQLNDEALRTFMCEAEAVVNSRPLTTETISSPDFLEALTPNHLLTMKTKVVLPPPGVFQAADRYSRKQWRRVQHLANEFWTRWRKEFLHSLQERKKWNRSRRNLQVDDVVIIKDDDTPRNQWRVARVLEAFKDEDGLVRKVKLAVGDPHLSNRGKRPKPMTVLERLIHKLVLMLSQESDERPGVPDEEP